MSRGRSRFSLSIRAKALLLSPLLLVIPYVGYQYVREMEDFLRQGLEESVVGTARALASALHGEPSLFAPAAAPSPGDGPVLYAHPLPAPLEVDGYLADWENHVAQMQPLSRLAGHAGASADAARYVAGKHGEHLYLLIVVQDDRVVYRQSQGTGVHDGDHCELALLGRDGVLRRYLLGTTSPGWVNAYEPNEGQDIPPGPVRIEIRVRAAWQATAEGYVLELRVPLAMVGDKVGVRIIDVDAPGERVASRKSPALWPLILPSREIESLIGRLGRMEGRRVWVLDRHRRVLARGGSLERPAPQTDVHPLYTLLLPPPSAEVFSEPPVVSHLDGPEIHRALLGTASTRWRAAAREGLWIVSGAFPVRSGEQIVGTVVVEETSLGIQTIRREAIANLFNVTLVVCVLGALVLLVFASRLVLRLRRLRDDAEAAIDPYGRVTGRLRGSYGHDEIGDLSQSFAAMMERLRQYNQYLENLARRLSHELRTPLAIVRSSLDSLQLDRRLEALDTYGPRAREGLDRLDTVITRMSEASRLEQAIRSAEVQTFDLAPVLASTVEAYRTLWAGREFDFDPPGGPIALRGVPDLIVQMLDKLVTNAIELGAADRPIAIRLARGEDAAALSVTNYGSALPEGMSGRLFDSMVSIRPASAETTPHLGLGLYIARLIAEFHGGRISGRNLNDGSGVEMRVEFTDVGRPVTGGAQGSNSPPAH